MRGSDPRMTRVRLHRCGATTCRSADRLRPRQFFRAGSPSAQAVEQALRLPLREPVAPAASAVLMPGGGAGGGLTPAGGGTAVCFGAGACGEPAAGGVAPGGVPAGGVPAGDDVLAVGV